MNGIESVEAVAGLDLGQEQVVIGGAAVDAGVTAARVLIAPWGQVNSCNGDFVLDEEGARLVIEAFEAHGTDLPIDYEHQSLGGKYASPSGQAPAAGWIKALRVVRPEESADAETRGRGDAAREQTEGQEEPGLYAEVEWTAVAQAKVAAREYRYLSPVVIVRKRDRRVVALHSAALTNKPAIVGMRPIVNSQGGESVAEDAKRQAETVDLHAEDANGQAGVDAGPHDRDARKQAGTVVAASAGVMEMGDEAVVVLRMKLGVDEAADDAMVLVAAGRRIAELEEAIGRREADERVQAAVRAGKLVAGQREWAMTLAMRDLVGFDEWAAAAPVVVMPGRTEPPTQRGGDRHRSVVVASARVAFRAEPSLALLTSESAWVEQALRDARIVEEG